MPTNTKSINLDQWRQNDGITETFPVLEQTDEPTLNPEGAVMDAALMPQVTNEMLGPNYYPDSRFDGRIDWDMGLLIMPLAGSPGDSPVVIQVHSPITYRAVEWTVSRKGQRPALPSSSTGNDNELVLSKSIIPVTPLLTANNQRIYRTSGRYEYVFLVPPSKDDVLPVGVSQADGANAIDLAIQPEDFYDRMLDDSEIEFAGSTTLADIGP